MKISGTYGGGGDGGKRELKILETRRFGGVSESSEEDRLRNITVNNKQNIIDRFISQIEPRNVVISKLNFCLSKMRE